MVINSLNSTYTSKLAETSLIEAVDTWLEQKLLESLKKYPFFSILADEYVNVSAQEELSICCQWVVNGQAEEHFLAILHISSCNAATIAEVLAVFVTSRQLDYRKLCSRTGL